MEIEVWGEQWPRWREGAQAGRGKPAGEAADTPLKSPVSWAPPIPDLISGCLSLEGAFFRAPQNPWGRRREQIKGQAP